LELLYFANPVAMLDMRTGAIVASVSPPWGGNGRGAWSPDGQFLVIPDGNGGGNVVYKLEMKPAPSLRAVRELEWPCRSNPINAT
jgi:hypothetical protein